MIAHSIEDAPTLQSTAAVAVSIIIPTYNDAPVLGRLLDALPAGRSDVERIVVDGGSSDTTRRIAAAHGVRVIGARRGRGTQMHAGACAANGSVLWFVHPHTAPPPDALVYIAHALADPGVAGGCFRVAFEGRGFAGLLLTLLYRVLNMLGVCYGDCAYFMWRGAYVAAGGYSAFIFEDIDLKRRLRRQGQFVRLGLVVRAVLRSGNLLVAVLRRAMLQLLYWLGVQPQTLTRWSQRPRAALPLNDWRTADGSR